MSTVSGAQGPLNCHGQSSGPIRSYGWGGGSGGHAAVFDTDHLKTKLVLLLEGVEEQSSLLKILAKLRVKQ